MNIRFKNSKLITQLALACLLNIGVFANIARATPANKAVKPQFKASSLRHQDNRAIDLHLTLSRVVAKRSKNKVFERSNPLEISQQDYLIPLPDLYLTARTFGGQASWYGPGFHGRLTASGERYNQNALTAAHPYLRFGTRVKVTNLNNGRSITLRINDRGPYAKGRVIDVSAAAARSLGMIKSGVAPVRVTVLGR